ncbi:MAG: hypothetical protein ACLGHT_08925, partial [Acidimicrobiia bacterium]
MSASRMLLCTWFSLIAIAGCGDAAVTVDNQAKSADDATGPAPWEKIAVPLPPRVQPALVATEDSLLVLGGVQPFEVPDCPEGASCAAPAPRPLTDGAVLNVASVAWTDVAPSPHPLWRPEAAIWTGTEFVTFGAAYNLGEQSWRSLPTPSFLAYDKLSWTGEFVTTTGWDYDRGQRNGIGQYIGAALDPTSPTWRVEPWPHEPPGMESARSVAVGDKVVAFVSTDQCSASDNPYCSAVVEWDPQSGAWRDVTELPGTFDAAPLGADQVMAVVSQDDVRVIDITPGSASKLEPPDVGFVRQIASGRDAAALLGLDGVAVLDVANNSWQKVELPEVQGD